MLYNRKSQRIKDTLGFSIWFTTIIADYSLLSR